MRKVQLKFGKQCLRRVTEVKKHGNVASFHLASRCMHSNLRGKGLTGKLKQGGIRKMGTKNPHYREQAKRSRGSNRAGLYS